MNFYNKRSILKDVSTIKELFTNTFLQWNNYFLMNFYNKRIIYKDISTIKELFSNEFLQ